MDQQYDERHQLKATRGWLENLPPAVRDHLFVAVADSVGPLEQRHMIDGLLDADYG